MRPVALLSRLWSMVLLTLFAPLLLSCLGGGGDAARPEGTPASALRRSFPEQAAKVLEQQDGFAVTEQGFALGRGVETRGELDVVLPREGGGAIRFRSGGSGEIRVRESDAEGTRDACRARRRLPALRRNDLLGSRARRRGRVAPPGGRCRANGRACGVVARQIPDHRAAEARWRPSRRHGWRRSRRAKTGLKKT